MATRMQQRRGTSAEWAAANPVLADGELGFEKDTGVIKFGNGSSTWNQLSAALGNTFLPVGGKAYDSDRLDGLDSTAFAQKAYVDGLILPPGLSRQTIIHFGSVTAFPTANLRVGDRCWRSDMLCEFYYNGGVWRQTSVARGTSTQRKAIVTTAGTTSLYDGFEFYESDTLFLRRWDGTRWAIEQWMGDRSGLANGVGAGVMGSMPGLALGWNNANIAHNIDTNYAAWTNTVAVPTQFATAGEAGVPLMQYVNSAGKGIKVNAKGTVRVTLFCTSDLGYAGRSTMVLLTNGANVGNWGSADDSRQRNIGYLGAGFCEQWIDIVMPVLPGDEFGCRVYQSNSNSSAATYQTALQATYI